MFLLLLSGILGILGVVLFVVMWVFVIIDVSSVDVLMWLFDVISM